MYKIQEHPETFAQMFGTDNFVTPVLTLKDEYGGISHIVIDDYCYVLINGADDRKFRKSYHWYSEAVGAIKTLPDPALHRQQKADDE